MKRVSILIITMALLLSTTTLCFAGNDNPSTWANQGIEDLKETKLMRDEAFSNYKGNITRGQFIYLAVRLHEAMKGQEASIDANIEFADTKDPFVLKGATLKITGGVGNNMFGYNDPLTREQLAVLMVNTLQLLDKDMVVNKDYKFKDEDTFSDWAKDKIYLAKANGIIGGVGNDTFDSKGYATTEQALIIANNILKKYDYVDANKIGTEEEKKPTMGLDEEYWFNLYNDDAFKAIMDEVDEVTESYVVPGMILIGENNYLNSNLALMRVYTSGENLEFNITGWNVEITRTTIRKMFNLWTPDGEYIWNELAVDSQHNQDEWFVCPNGTQVFMTDKSDGFTVKIKK